MDIHSFLKCRFEEMFIDAHRMVKLRVISYKCLKTRCSGKYLDGRGMEWPVRGILRRGELFDLYRSVLLLG
jgi:hypothetical protein